MTTSINAFLIKARTQLKDSPIHQVVMGNGAADLDSMASSLVYAYLLGSRDPRKKVIPLVPIPRADFKLRTEAVFVFERAGIDLNALISMDDVDLESPMENTVELVLVDHNTLAPQFRRFRDKVSTILDHHADQGDHPRVSKRVIAPVGSTATLVGEEIQARAPELLEGPVATLLYGTLLLDTVNLDGAAGRVTPRDRAMAALLAGKVDMDQHAYFKAVQAAKFDTRGLSTQDLLRRDYKEFQFGSVTCGIASVLLPLAEWAKRDRALAGGFESWARARNLDLVLSMNAYVRPGFTRELAVHCRDRQLHDSLVAFLRERGVVTAPLGMSEYPMPCREGTLSFHGPADPGISRKGMVPLLSLFFNP